MVSAILHLVRGKMSVEAVLVKVLHDDVYCVDLKQYAE